MIEIRPAGKRVRIVFNNEVIAESRDALVMQEGKYPPVLVGMLADKDANKAKRTMDAMMQMRKLDLKKLKEAYDG